MPSKMYILVREKMIEEHFGLAITSVAHAGAAAITQFGHLDETKEWVAKSFRKVVCKVSDEEFDKAKEQKGWKLLTESIIDNQDMCLVFHPREEWPKFFKYLRLWR